MYIKKRKILVLSVPRLQKHILSTTLFLIKGINIIFKYVDIFVFIIAGGKSKKFLIK